MKNPYNLSDKQAKILIKDWLTQNELQAYTGMGRQKITELVTQGLPYYTLDGKTIFYNKKDFYEFMQKYKKNGSL